MKSKEAAKKGLFGHGKPSTKFLQRVGDLLIVPKRKMILFKEEEKVMHFLGHHGGLTEEEMLVLFAATKISKSKYSIK